MIFQSYQNIPIRLQVCNDTQIILIPKISTPESMFDLRPISLYNVLYKILAKTIANIIKPLLPTFISNPQSAFVPGRLIYDNLLLAYEVHHFLNKKTQGKEVWVSMKIDMSKAFDRVNWILLKGILEKLGFCDIFVDLIMACISKVRFSVIQDGIDIGLVTPYRGLRYGDPLSPYLFIIMVEGLSALIDLEARRGELHGVVITKGAPALTHVFFR